MIAKKGPIVKGENLLELVKFEVGSNLFGINVMKVREVIEPVPITNIPHSHPYVEGMVTVRGEVSPVISLFSVYGLEPANQLDEKFMIAEMNQKKLVFRCDAVYQIHRVSWKQIDGPEAINHSFESYITGMFELDDKLVFLPDFEKIVCDIEADNGYNAYQVHERGNRKIRVDKRLIVVEDSPFLRNMLETELTNAGYHTIQCFKDGEEAYRHMMSLISEGSMLHEYVDLVITDIEMPKLDGFHLTNQLKEDPRCANVPVVIFSSLITEEMKYRGQKVGADEQISKPEINLLIDKVDTLLM